jgi:hypothetical protein
MSALCAHPHKKTTLGLKTGFGGDFAGIANITNKKRR